MAKAGAGGQRQAARQAEQEAGRILVTGSGCIDNFQNRLCRYGNRRAFTDDDRALLATRDGGDRTFRLQSAEGRTEIICLV